MHIGKKGGKTNSIIQNDNNKHLNFSIGYVFTFIDTKSYKKTRFCLFIKGDPKYSLRNLYRQIKV